MAILDSALQVCPAPEARQLEILFDPLSYSAFPHVVRLEGDELLMSFRQAPREAKVRHTHPRSIITVMRSYDNGLTWDAIGAAQLAAGGGQELGLLYLGQGKVVGALAKHEVVPEPEGVRAGVPRHGSGEYPYRTPGVYWVWSDNYGFVWSLHDVLLMGPGAFPCAAPIRLRDGTLLVPAYGRPAHLASTSSVLYRSADGGQTWCAPIVMAEGGVQTREYAEPALVEREPGQLRAMHRTEQEKALDRGGYFWTNESFDGGKTWSVPLNTGILSGACPRLFNLTDGRVLLTFGRRPAPCGIRAMLSEDGGQTWGNTAWLLRETPNGNQGYTSSIELEGGRILTVTYAQNSAGITGIVGTIWRLP